VIIRLIGASRRWRTSGCRSGALRRLRDDLHLFRFLPGCPLPRGRRVLMELPARLAAMHRLEKGWP
jgi:hypothetical protein